MEDSIEVQILDRLRQLEKDVAYIRGEISGRNHRSSQLFTRVSTIISHFISLSTVVIGIVFLMHKILKN